MPLASLLGALAVTGVLMCLLVIYTSARAQSRQGPRGARRLAATTRLSAEGVQVFRCSGVEEGAPQHRHPQSGYPIRTPEHRGEAASDRSLVDRVINEATSRDFTVLVVACALLGRLEWVAWAAAVGSHLFWLLFAALQLSLYRTADAESG
jgi:hypothetical protein